MHLNREEANFISRNKDTFVGYVNGVKSTRGYLLFTDYIVDMDNSLPVPFFGVDIEPNDVRTGFGCLVDEKEAAIIYKGFMFTCNSYLDCHFSLDSN
jgi:hypothetical protein